MKNIYKAIEQSPLWKNIEYSEFEGIIKCIAGSIRHYEKNSVIIMTGDKLNHIGLIISGSVKVIKEDLCGKTFVLTELAAADLFGEVFACANIDYSPVTVLASGKCEVLFIDYRKVITVCSSACVFHIRLIENMLNLIAQKNLLLNQKLEILSKSTTRKKLLALFDIYRKTANKFVIPYNREEMADYLSVDRSAMSKELCKMRDEGLIKFHKNKFEIL